MSALTTLYPPEGFGAPKHRKGHATRELGLPAGTEIFSADNHISVADDIFYERFPDDLKGAAPRIWYEDGAYMVGMKGKAWTGGDFGRVLMQYDDLAGAATNNIEARIRELREDGIDKELAFPNAVLALFHYPDKGIRERVFRIYNEVMAELQERSNGHFYGVGLINWWDPAGTRSTLEQLKSLGLKTFLLPLNPGKDDEGNIYDYGSTEMDAVWDEIEAAGLPVSHHIGETPPKTPCQHNSVVVGMMVNVDSFREQFAKYVFSGILDRHPSLRIGWFEGGIAWVPTALQDAEHMLASYRHMFNHELQQDIRYYWDHHMSASFMVDPLGLRLLDEIGVDNVMWSSDYPHNESTFGYSERSLATVVDAVGPENAVKIVSTNIQKFLGLTTA
ncbi:amidohydrolase [Mycolicibacterium cosmeticum]|uniref:Amidohydrolase n=1 Tax=Mycolicibacterium cosmeticum TaxID=258533 RepID=W9ATG2_MYCCO|nr:amidohydrolase family protein [Mycolicibacterium cosmeticum]TLH69648.1 amidohydrolase [Mycolicibacterium cosmeticum]CDO06177.1 amidohydrolase [Mycolicibacterium cosmeticum]